MKKSNPRYDGYVTGVILDAITSNLDNIAKLKLGKPGGNSFKIRTMADLEDKHIVPKNMEEVFAELTRLTDAFCQEHLNDEYAVVCKKLTAALCRKQPSILTRGMTLSWAAGIVYTAGWINFLSDIEQSPHMSTKDLAEKFGLGISTLHSKKSKIQKNLNLMQLEPQYTLSSQLEDNPLVWMVEINGIVIDIRNTSPELQKDALGNGLIPFIPTGKRKQRRSKQDMTFKIPVQKKKTIPPKKTLPQIDEGPTLFDGLED